MLVITLTSGDSKTLQVPATVTIPYGQFSVTFNATTVVVTGTKGVAVKAAYNSSSITSTIQVVPLPTVTIALNLGGERLKVEIVVEKDRAIATQ